MKKGIYFLLVLVTLCYYSCSTPSGEAQEGETTTVQGEENATGTANESTTTPPADRGVSKITDDIVSQVCDCQREAKSEDGVMDIEKVRSCMGAASSTEYVANLLGPSATEKERTDAQNELLKRTANCPS